VVEKVTREQLLKRLTALAEDALDYAERYAPQGFDLGVVGLVFEVLFEGERDEHLRRSDAGYTPEDGVACAFITYCSDTRRWVKEKIFEEAYDLHKYGGIGDDGDDDDDDDDDDSERTEDDF
jgi:hypothetical protein